MRRILNSKVISGIIVLGLLSCTRNFKEINTNPNDPTIVDPGYLLAKSVLSTMNTFGGEMNRVIFFNYTQHFSGFQGEFQRYTYAPNSNDNYWSSTFIASLQPVNQIEEKYRSKPAFKNRVLIARLWKDYIFSNAVAVWGGIPVNDALTGEPSIPYTREEDVYLYLLKDLKNIYDSIDINGDKYSASADKIYAGNLLSWKKFANTLRLSLAVRISNAAPNGNPEVARPVIQEIYNDRTNTINSNAETAAAQWGVKSDTWNPLYDRAVYNFTANQATIPVLGETLVYFTKPYNDPRLAVYGKPATQGPYKGTYFGQNIAYGGGGQFAGGIINPHTGLKQVDYSPIGDRFTKPDAEYIFLSYAQSCFLKAEMALKGWWGNAGDAESEYYKGIAASFERYGISAASLNSYKNVLGIKWGTASDTTGHREEFMDWLQLFDSFVEPGDFQRQIVMQHWLAIPFQGVDSWTLQRRTRKLLFEPQFATYDGAYKYLPERIIYPASEYQTNPQEVSKAVSYLNGSDDLFTKLWFSLPGTKHPLLP